MPSAATIATPAETVFLAYDVSKDKVDLYTEIAGRQIRRVVQCRFTALQAHLKTLSSLAQQAGARKVVVLAEPTGGYQDPLLHAARSLGLETAWVSGEAVHKMRVVEFNDSGKTDPKDSRVIHTLGCLGKTLQHRPLEEPYSLLRQWHRIYEAAACRVIDLKGAIQRELHALFPDLSFKRDFRFGRGGQALMQTYRFNPYRMSAAGFETFADRVRKAYPTIQPSSLKRLFRDAEAAACTALPLRHVQLHEFCLLQLWQDWQREEERKTLARQAMESLYGEARQLDPRLPEGQSGVAGAFHLARIVAETGPLSDFSSWQKLTRFAGLNLRERQSGKYRGKTRLSKKGRNLLRKVLGQVVLPLVRRTALYGPYYHRKREQERMPGTKAMVAVMRKFLKMLYGWYRSGGAFDPQRVFQCSSVYRQAA